MTDLRPLLQIASAALDQASKLVTDKAVGVVRSKGDRDMVSEIDLTVEDHVRSFLQKVIDLPFMRHRFHAAHGHGAYSDGEPIQTSRTQDLNKAIVAIGDYAVGARASERNVRRLALTRLLAEQALRVRMLGSAAIDLVWVASGKLDASVTLSNHPWDMAAGVVIAREAGAVVMDLDGSPHSLGSAATIAVAPGLRDALRQMTVRL